MLTHWAGVHAFSVPASMAGHMAWVLGVVLLLLLLLLLALWVDKYFGEPPVCVHPVVWMGNYLRACGSVTVRCLPAPAFFLGALAWWVGVALVGAVAWGVQALVFWQLAGYIKAPAWGSAIDTALLAVPMAWLLKCMLSWRMLREEVGAVELALGQSLEAGRERLSWLVSRDTTQLTESQVRESAIESLAENLNDSVVAPIFWFVLLGLPGAAVYRFTNTADAMWGYRGTYRGKNWEWAGKWAARADDMLSWLPARLTALLLAMGAKGLQLKALREEARKTPSPNSGWPMAAMALALGISLGKPGVYTLNPQGRAPELSDSALAQSLASKAVLSLTLVAVAVMLLMALAASA